MEAKYIVTVNIMSANEKGIKTSKSFDYTFQEKDFIKARNNAISKVKELEKEFLFGDVKYDSFLEAQLKDFKNFNAYSINMLFIPSEDWDYCLYGEDEEQTIEALKAEVYHYAEDDGIPLTEVEFEDGEWDYVEVIESDLEFFLN